jgi:hypothetical protein
MRFCQAIYNYIFVICTDGETACSGSVYLYREEI